MNIYQEHILDLYKHPKNFGSLDSYTNSSHVHNPLCGDELIVELDIENNIVKDVKFSGQGCAISIASASMLTEKIKGMPVNKIKNLKSQDVLSMLNIPISSVRLKCALLSLDAVKEAINVK